METAVGLYFRSDPAAFVIHLSLGNLRNILGPAVTSHQAEQLLARANNSVHQAVELFYNTAGEKAPSVVLLSQEGLFHESSFFILP